MHRYYEFFGARKPSSWNGKVITPVIHLPGYNEAFEAVVREVGIARAAGADGAFLISHGQLNCDQLIEVWRFVTGELMRAGIDFPVGINPLDLTYSPGDMIRKAAEAGIELIWSDATGGQPEIEKARQETGWNGLYCGAFAFKHQEIVSNEDLPEVLEKAFGYMDIPVTSGEATGVPIDLAKARICRDTAGDRPLGLASGFSAENAPELLPFFDWILVASSIQLGDDFYRQDPKKAQRTFKTVEDWRPAA